MTSTSNRNWIKCVLQEVLTSIAAILSVKPNRFVFLFQFLDTGSPNWTVNSCRSFSFYSRFCFLYKVIFSSSTLDFKHSRVFNHFWLEGYSFVMFWNFSSIDPEFLNNSSSGVSEFFPVCCLYTETFEITLLSIFYCSWKVGCEELPLGLNYTNLFLHSKYYNLYYNWLRCWLQTYNILLRFFFLLK